MPRPPKRRRIAHSPLAVYYKPQGVPLKQLQEIELALDGLEAMRLSHLEKLSQAEVGEKMGISRATVGRILDSAHQAVTEALVHGRAIRIEGQLAEGAPGVGGRRRRGGDSEWGDSESGDGLGRPGRGRGRGRRKHGGGRGGQSV